MLVGLLLNVVLVMWLFFCKLFNSVGLQVVLMVCCVFVKRVCLGLIVSV